MSREIKFQMSVNMATEMDRLLRMIQGNVGDVELFRRAFTLLRIHVDAAAEGRKIRMENPYWQDQWDHLVLPFDVRREDYHA